MNFFILWFVAFACVVMEAHSSRFWHGSDLKYIIHDLVAAAVVTGVAASLIIKLLEAVT